MNVEPAGYNEAKRDILDIIRTRGETTAAEIALITNRTTENSSMRLMNYISRGFSPDVKYMEKKGATLSPIVA